MGLTTPPMQQARGTAAQWAASTLVLAAGQLGFETDTGKLKGGDGVRTWGNLPYVDNGSIVVVEHGDNAAAARPNVPVVVWLGLARPANMNTLSDLWPSSASDIQALIDTGITVKVAGLRPQTLVRGCSYLTSSSYTPGSRPVNYDPQRRRVIIQNIGATVIQATPKNTSNIDFNAPSTAQWAAGVVINPGEEWVSTSTFTHFVRPNVSGETYEAHVYTEAVSA